MNAKSCSVVFDGKIVNGQTLEEVQKNLARLFKVNAGRVELLFSRPPRILKRNLSHSAAIKYQRALEKAGAVCRIKPDEEPDIITNKMNMEQGNPSACGEDDRMICPMCDYEQSSAEECIRCGTVIRKYLKKVNSPSVIAYPVGSTQDGRKSTGRSFRVSWLLPVPVIFVLVIMLFNWRESLPISHGPGVLAPDIPVQTLIRSPEIFSHKDFQITPLATFEIEARVLSVKYYHFDRQSDLSTIDLALGWGPMSDENVLKDIRIKQSNRFYYWRVKQLPIPRREIEENSANMHIVPANKNIKKRLKDIRKGHVVRFNGYLVRVDAKDNWHWKSSLTRKDTGRGACEVIWVEELEII